MKTSLGNLWGTLLNSEQIHRFIKTGPGSVLFRSQPLQKFNMARLHLYSNYQGRKNQEAFSPVHTLCLFIGHTKSGNSMLGSFIDAHPNAILADEADILHYVLADFKREQLFQILLRASKREFHKGRVTARRMDPYSWQVPDQWQGRFSSLNLIGDSTSGTTTRRLAETPGLFNQLSQTMGKVNVKFIHTVRNPFDPISIMMVRGKKTFAEAFDHYELGCNRLATLYQRIEPENILSIRYEAFIDKPRAQLARLCNYLGLEASPDYIEACCKILRSELDKPRTLVNWQADWIDQVHLKITQVDFLKDYTFEN